MDANQIRRTLAAEYWECKRAIRQAHLSGNYYAAAVLRNALNLTFLCWQYQRSV